MKRGLTHKLLAWQRDAIVAALLGREKVEAIAAEFGVSKSYPALLARRYGHPSRPRGRPTKSAQLPKGMVAA